MSRFEIRRTLRRRGAALAGAIPHPMERLCRFFEETIWDDRALSNGLRRLFYPKLRVLTLVYRNYWAHNLSRHAAALTYSSVLAIVPVLAVGFSLFTAFGGLGEGRETLQSWIFELLSPSESQRERIREMIQGSLDAVQKGAQANALFATILLFVTVVNTISWIESSFNELFGIQRSRSLYARFTVYWAVATLGPVLLGTSLAMTASFRSSAFLQWFRTHVPLFVELGYRIAPIFLTIAGFTLLYRFLPNTRVKARAALAGGAIGGLFFEIAKSGFARTADTLLSSYHRVYGGIALLFVFFFWIWLSWMVLLLGLEFVVATQSAATHRREELAAQSSQRVREIVGLRVMTEIAEKFFRGELPPAASSLAGKLNLPIRLIYDVTQKLEDCGIVRAIYEGEEEIGFLPGRHLENLSPYDVLAALRTDQGGGLSLGEDEEARQIERLFQAEDEADRRIYGAESFARLVERLAAPPASREEVETRERPSDDESAASAPRAFSTKRGETSESGLPQGAKR